jgi:hypothetical protein
MIDLYAPVRTTVDVLQFGLKTGARGVVVDVYSDPQPAYEIEFIDDDGDTLGCLSMKPDEVVADTHPLRHAA